VTGGGTVKVEARREERRYPENYDRAATALSQSRRLLNEAEAELRVALRILGRLEAEELPPTLAPPDEWLHGLMNSLLLLEASERTFEEACPLL